jgi:hypothetical protein
VLQNFLASQLSAVPHFDAAMLLMRALSNIAGKTEGYSKRRMNGLEFALLRKMVAASQFSWQRCQVLLTFA